MERGAGKGLARLKKRRRRSSLGLITALVACVAISSLLFFPGLSWEQDLERGYRNYLAILDGRKTFESLSPEEQIEVLMVFRMLREESGDVSDGCRDAKEQAEAAASELESKARRLLRCAEARNFYDDCSYEFRKVKSAHWDYESAVSEVQSDC